MRHTILTLGLLPACLMLGACSASGPSSTTPAATTPAGTAAASATPRDAGLGAMPSFLPTPSAGQIPTGTPQRPALSYPGSPVEILTPSGRVRVHVDGPSYPASTKVGAESVACTFTVLLDAASAPIELSGLRFDVLDHAGTIHPVPLASGSPRPTRILPGQEVRLALTATLPSGEGVLRLFLANRSASAGWDYVAETD